MELHEFELRLGYIVSSRHKAINSKEFTSHHKDEACRLNQLDIL